MRAGPGELELFRIAGVRIAIHYSWFVVFALVGWSLAAGYFPARHPGHGWAAYVLVGLAATCLFFASVLVHELAHAAVANRLGQEVRRITLFIFGGMAHLSGEPRDAAAEFRIAVVGPLTSLGLAGVFWLLLRATPGPGNGLWAALLQYLAFVNVALALFNLLPGFPLDGGRLLRAYFWRRSGDMRAATARAARFGMWIASVLIAVGAVQVLLSAGSAVGGLWLVFIGLFLRGAARAGLQATLVETMLHGARVRDIMVTEPVTIDAGTPVAEALDAYFLRYGHTGFPVREDGRVGGLVSLVEVLGCPAAERARRRVRDVMRPADRALRIAPSASVSEALRRMDDAGSGRLLVMEGDELRGLVTRTGIARFADLRAQLDAETRRPAGAAAPSAAR